VLRPGGRLVFADMMFGWSPAVGRNREVLGAKVRAISRRGPAGWLRLASNAGRLLTGRGEYPAAEWWRAALLQAGFDEIEIELLSHEGGIGRPSGRDERDGGAARYPPRRDPAAAGRGRGGAGTCRGGRGAAFATGGSGGRGGGAEPAAPARPAVVTVALGGDPLAHARVGELRRPQALAALAARIPLHRVGRVGKASITYAVDRAAGSAQGVGRSPSQSARSPPTSPCR
jgi:hypothetical protein